MPLGIEQNNIAPQLIQNSGAALVQGIRQIGQQISGHLTEIQTKRDLGALAQEMQGINVQSNDFPVQLTQLLSRHPLAARDERGQIALSILGKAHGQWQQQQIAGARINPYRSMAGGGIYNANTGEVKVEPTTRPVNVPRNSRLTDPVTGEVIVDAEALPEKGFNLSPGATRYDAQGKPIVTAPGRTGAEGLTPYQMEMKRRAETRRKMELVKSKLSQTGQDIKSLEKRYLDLNEEESKLNSRKADHLPKLQKIYDFRKEVGARLEALGKEREQLQQEFEQAALGNDEAVVDEELGAVPPNAAAPSAVLPGAPAVLPAPSAVTVPAAGANVRRVPVLDPNGNPLNIREDQLESALQAGWKRR